MEADWDDIPDNHAGFTDKKNCSLQPGFGYHKRSEGCNPLIFIRNKESEKAGK
jgi:hypothetical protein